MSFKDLKIRLVKLKNNELFSDTDKDKEKDVDYKKSQTQKNNWRKNKPKYLRGIKRASRLNIYKDIRKSNLL